MFKTLSTLIVGSSARAEDRVRDAFAIELIDQKIREADAQLKAAKATLASMIQRQRSEKSQRDALQTRLSEMTERARAALDAGDEELALQAAEAIAQMENELTLRATTCERLDQKAMRLRTNIETGHRRIIDLKQGAIQARAVRREQALGGTAIAGSHASATQEAEELIQRVLGADDQFEHSQIVEDINDDLSHGSLTNKLAAAGYGDPTKATASDVLARLKSKK